MNRTYAVRTPDPKTGRTEQRRQALESLLSLFKQLGESYYLSTHHQTPLALHILTSLPITHQQTPYVLSHTALAHFELADYTTAALTFSTLRKHSPHQTQHMDIYSTCLWHLRRPIDLTLLSYELSELSRHTPETWCAIGNSFSLDRDHSNAGKCFKRATQLNPKFAYGYTLEGHEYIAHEEFELAIQAFRKAVVVRKRHYNAWYGLGIAFLRLGKFACAEAYFRRAARIKPRCEVLVGGVGMALEAQRNFPAALNHYTAAANLAPKSIAPRERKVRLLLQMNDIKAAASELEVLRGLAPQRGFVYVLLGRMYALDGDKEMAVRSFGRAMGLCPECISSQAILYK
ncbi:putative protein bimA [Glarea lozoyensis 74030]|uniref:Uncharacterized protein n=1 Tax=Glarea lozoyensis (strain ATCC 74030 / MF5533) TaxID=1104152 RepID=H0EP69_GLAL7|nr:putative protein bimA [Glarea lozoyensis 74030]